VKGLVLFSGQILAFFALFWTCFDGPEIVQESKWFRDQGVYFRKTKSADLYSLSAWLSLSRNGTFISKDGFHDCYRSSSKGVFRWFTTKKRREVPLGNRSPFFI